MSRPASDAPWLRGLNHEQRRAVLHTEGPLLILAGAGSGKTRTLVHRIVNLIHGESVPPARIVAVTFTNKAADEMRERVRVYAGEVARKVTVSTFHALGARMLRQHAERAGLPRRFAIYDTADQLGALRTATAEISIDDDAFDLKRILRRISDWKSRRIDPAAAVREVAAEAEKGTRADDHAVLAADAFPKYEEVLRASGAVDFDDLLLAPVRLLEEDEEVRRDVWRRWQYVMVDEYQDTNSAQLHFARLLAGARRNLCVVGDDDQSIYAFRGADVGNILDFERHFPGAQVVTLEQNYRSTKRILAAANAVISGNSHRHPKKLRTSNGVGAPIDVYEHADEQTEADVLAKEIGTRKLGMKLRWSDLAVLYRTNPQSRPIEEALRARNIPYRVVGGTSFFDRKEVADCIAYLRAVANPADELALRRIINHPPRGIGRTTVLRVGEVARARGIGFEEALASSADPGTAAGAAIGAFLDLLAAARAGLDDAERAAQRPPRNDGQPPIADWADALFRRLRLEEHVRTDRRNARSADARADNIRDVAGTIARCERMTWAAAGVEGATAADGEEWSPPTLVDALARLALSEMDEEDEEWSDAVTLMTMHSAKGLEFTDVFIVGLEDGLLPHARALHDAEESRGAADPIAEERRLLYVAMTRARERLVLSRCASRRRAGQATPAQPSRYLQEIPEELLNPKTAEVIRTPEESVELRRNFMDQMKAMLAPET